MPAPRRLLVFFFVTLSLVQTVVCARDRQTVACTPGKDTTASVSPVEPSLSLTCGERSVRGIPTVDAKLYKYTGGSCDMATGQENGTLLETLSAKGTWSNGQLSLSKFPDQKQKVCLLCRDTQQITCKVIVDIATEAATCAEKRSAAGELVLTLAEKETVYFKCPGGDDKLTPGTATQAYRGDCGSEVENLAAGLVRQGSDSIGAYSLTLNEASVNAKTFCYKCGSAAAAARTADTCLIKVTTKTTTQTPGDQPSTSATAMPETSSMIAWGILLVTLMHLREA